MLQSSSLHENCKKIGNSSVRENPVATIKTERGTIHYRDYRKQTEGSPLVLVHGAGGTFLDWPVQMRRGLEAIALDLPGHGESAPPGRDRIPAYAADVGAFLRALDLRSAILVGHSMGGAIVQQIALDEPDRVRGLILVGTGARLRVNELILNGIVSDNEATAQQIATWAWAPHVAEEMREQMAQRLMETDPEVTRGDFVACNEFDVRERLGEIGAPTLVLAGADDKMVKLRFSEEMHHALPDSTLVVLENAGHMFPLEQPETVVEIIQKWLAEQHPSEG